MQPPLGWSSRGTAALRQGTGLATPNPGAGWEPLPRLHLGPSLQQGAEVGAEPAGWGAAAQWGAEELDNADPVRVLTLPLQAQQAMGRMEEFVFKVWEGRWRVIPYDVLPDWLKDNDFLLHGHRPPMPSFRACFRSIFRLHTETGNIWTHLIGFLFFLILGIGYLFSPNVNYVAPVQERVVFGMFFLGATLCLCFSWLFHTVYCHSERVSRTFSKLDYSGITLLIVGSFVPWLYYSFYCSPQPQLIYLIIVCALGVTAITVSQSDHFSTPQYRAVRAGGGLGAQGGGGAWLAPARRGGRSQAHPSPFLPHSPQFNSHQIFHVLVVAGAGVHLHGVSQLQAFRSSLGGTCTESTVL
uniref:Adiponectin receptor 1 n=1 Tax=Gopherus agassizii TaxID=38772 RepID=A0A452GJE0_9SAUR